MLHRRPPVVLLSLFFVFGGVVPAFGQSVASVVDEMQARYNKQLETVDTYIVETNLYTSYNKKVMRDGAPTYKTQTKMKGPDDTGFASTTTPSAAYGLQFDKLKQHATYTGTESLNGVRCHVLSVDDPSKVNPDLGAETTRMIYYVNAEQHVPARMVMETETQGQGGPQASTVTINLLDYTTTDGLTLPHRMEIRLSSNLSAQQRQQMERMMKQMENMPEEQRRQMEKMMGQQMGMMKRMLSGEPIAVTVERVQVNTELPSGLF